MRVLFRESSILGISFFIPFSFALDTMLLPFIRFEAKLVYSLRETADKPLFYPLTDPKVHQISSPPLPPPPPPLDHGFLQGEYVHEWTTRMHV
eukprot:scaffold260_cov40-Phaeocystis_antarctica.AAC.1